MFCPDPPVRLPLRGSVPRHVSEIGYRFFVTRRNSETYRSAHSMSVMKTLIPIYPAVTVPRFVRPEQE